MSGAAGTTLTVILTCRLTCKDAFLSDVDRIGLKLIALGHDAIRGKLVDANAAARLLLGESRRTAVIK